MLTQHIFEPDSSNDTSSSEECESDTHDQESTEFNETQFWHKIGSLNWRDLSDGKMSIPASRNALYKDMSSESIDAFKKYLETYVEDLREIMESAGIIGSYPIFDDENQIRAFLSHIIARGELYYSSIYTSPEISGYLIPSNPSDPPEYQSLYQIVH